MNRELSDVQKILLKSKLKDYKIQSEKSIGAKRFTIGFNKL